MKLILKFSALKINLKNIKLQLNLKFFPPKAAEGLKTNGLLRLLTNLQCDLGVDSNRCIIFTKIRDLNDI